MGEPVRLLLDLDGRVRVVASYFGADDRFQAYLGAINGAVYDRERRCEYAPLDKVDGILRRLADAGFDASIDDDLRGVLDQRKKQAWTDTQATVDRIASIDAEMTARLGHGLRPYQHDGVLWMVGRTTGILADEMRLGKTLQTLVALPAGAPVLVMCPSGAKDVWLAELSRWRPNIPVAVLDGRGTFRWPRKNEVVIANFEILPEVDDRAGVRGRRCDGTLPPDPCPGCATRRVRTDRPCRACRPRLVFSAHRAGTRYEGHLPTCDGRIWEDQPGHHARGCKGFLKAKRCGGCHPMLDDCLPETVGIVDEAHWIKNPESKRGHQARAILRAIRRKTGRTFGLSGTPLEREPPELWELLLAFDVAHEAFGDFRTFARSFGGTYKGNKRGYSWPDTPRPEAAERIARVMMRRRYVEVWRHLPPKVHRKIKVSVDAATLRQCDEAMRSITCSFDDLQEHLERSAVPFPLISQARKALATAKIPALLERVAYHESESNPILVFSCHLAPLHVLAARKGWAQITGAEKNKKEIADRFNRGEFVGVAISITAGGTALDLSRAEGVVMVDRDYRPSANAQAIARAIGFTDKRGLVVEDLVSSHVLDDRLYEVLTRRESVIAGSIDAAASRAAASIGTAPRRGATSDEERLAIEVLRVGMFAAGDERAASDLTRAAAAIGLTEEGWREVVAIGRRLSTADDAAEVEDGEGVEQSERDEVDQDEGGVPLEGAP